MASSTPSVQGPVFPLTHARPLVLVFSKLEPLRGLKRSMWGCCWLMVTVHGWWWWRRAGCIRERPWWLRSTQEERLPRVPVGCTLLLLRVAFVGGSMVRPADLIDGPAALHLPGTGAFLRAGAALSSWGRACRWGVSLTPGSRVTGSHDRSWPWHGAGCHAPLGWGRTSLSPAIANSAVRGAFSPPRACSSS